MRIVIAGGSGFLGTALTDALVHDNHTVTVLTRQPGRDRPGNTRVSSRVWEPNGQIGAWADAVDGADAVVNLAGESIAARRWSAAQKQRIRDSRLEATRSLTAAIRQAQKKPALISGSAVGYYGDRGEEPLNEASAPGNDFLAGVAQEWEAAANEAAAVTRVVCMRTGIVLDRRGGALAKMLPPFMFFVGGPLGTGNQYMPWIHKTDWVRLVIWAINTDTTRGPVNATGPAPVTNREFAKALGRAMGRPSIFPAPAFALRVALGEMADALLLGGQRALPVRATDLGFVFHFPNVDAALGDIFK